MSPEQCRAARAWLGWSQQQLANKSGVSASTVRDFETGRRIPIANNLRAIRRALEDAGIQFLFADHVPLGVAFPKAASHVAARNDKPKVRPKPKPRKRRR